MDTKTVELNNVELSIILNSLSLDIKMRESEIINESSKLRSKAILHSIKELQEKLVNEHFEVVEIFQ